jgi:cystathionine beta-lyase/cystathionine gamma-synthase
MRATTPIFQTSAFGQPGPFEHSRSGNPTRQGGTAGFAFATGMAAEMMFETGDTIAVHHDLYGDTYRLFQSVFRDKQAASSR